jgi:hypothetical protein
MFTIPELVLLIGFALLLPVKNVSKYSPKMEEILSFYTANSHCHYSVLESMKYFPKCTVVFFIEILLLSFPE